MPSTQRSRGAVEPAVGLSPWEMCRTVPGSPVRCRVCTSVSFCRIYDYRKTLPALTLIDLLMTQVSLAMSSVPKWPCPHEKHKFVGERGEAQKSTLGQLTLKWSDWILHAVKG